MFKKLISLLAICLIIGFTSVPTFSADTNVSVNINSTFIDLQNVVILNNSTTPNTKIDMSWSNLIIGTAQTQQTSILTLDATTTGANGMDSGSLASNTWYYLYGISNGSTTASLLSTSSTSPTMPTGYTQKRTISTFLTDGSAHLYKQRQIDREVWWEGVVDFSNNSDHIIDFNNSTFGSFITSDASAYVSPLATRIYTRWSILDNGAVGNTAKIYYKPNGSSMSNPGTQVQMIPSPMIAFTMMFDIILVTDSTHKFQWQMLVSGTPNFATWIYATGYHLPI